MNRFVWRELLLGAVVGVLLAAHGAYAYFAVREERIRLTDSLAQCAARLGREIASAEVSAPGVGPRPIRLDAPCDRIRVITRRPAASAATSEVALVNPTLSLASMTEPLDPGHARLATVDGMRVLAYKLPKSERVVLLDASRISEVEWGVWRNHASRILVLTAVLGLATALRGRRSEGHRLAPVSPSTRTA